MDTEMESTAHYNCTQTYTCGTADPMHNYMNYTDDDCMDRFSQEQANRSVCSLVNYRPQLGQITPVEPSITVTSPNGGESWEVGTFHDITWTTTGTVGNVKIEYSIDNGSGWNTIELSTANDGTYSWTIPIAISSQCLVRISEASDGSPSDTSYSQFSIVPESTTCTNSVPSDNWKGDYYNNMDLSGSASMTRDDGESSFNFDWGTGSPSTSCGIGADEFSVRWTRTASFSSGTWRFTVTSDDGFRLYVDGSLVLDYWIDQPPTTYTVDVALTSGDHTIKLEYYENSVTAVAKLSWEKQ